MKISPPYVRFYVTLLASLLVFNLRDTFAQGLGELARQERARKQSRQSRVTKVFTNEDLERSVIIGPEERAALNEAGAQQETALAESTPEPAPVPIHLTLAPQAIPAKEIAAPAKQFVERAVPTVPLWPSAMPLGDIARYYRQQVAPQIPPVEDRTIADALAHAPVLRNYAADKLRIALAPVADESGAAPVRSAANEINLPAPFVMARAEGSGVPVIENVVEEAVPAFPSPAINLQLAEAAAPAGPRREGLRFAAPELGDVVLSFSHLGESNASLGLLSLAGEQFGAPMYDSSREPLTIRFPAPEPAPAVAPRAPLARTAEDVAAPQLRATITSTSIHSTPTLETVSPWRYADELPAAPPAPLAAEPARMVIVSTVEPSAAAPQAGGQEVRIERGDSLWKLALRHFGDGKAWPRIAAANPQLANPNHIRSGERLRMPGNVVKAALAARPAKPIAPAANAGYTLTVRKGDSLWKLAETALGSGAAWSCIAGANPQITDADRILAGQTLVLPTNCNPQS